MRSAEPHHAGRLKKVQLRGGAREPRARRTSCTLSVRPRAPTKILGGGLRPPSEASPQDSLRRQSRRSGVEHSYAVAEKARPEPIGSRTRHRWVFRFERGLCPRPGLGENSEGPSRPPPMKTTVARTGRLADACYRRRPARGSPTWRAPLATPPFSIPCRGR